MKPLVPIVIILFFLLLSGGLLAAQAKFNLRLPSPTLPAIRLNLPSFLTPATPSPSMPIFTNLIEATPSSKVTSPPKPTAKPTLKPAAKTQVKSPTARPKTGICYRYTVPHLDGSSSTKCYSETNYQELVSLGSELRSAQTFYQFHLKGVSEYQRQYEITGSSIYLDAKASSQAKADAENAKIGPLSLKMYALEAQGW